jgi:hypothetical protein
VDERSQNRWRRRLVRAVARRLRAWAEAVLSEAPRPGAAGGPALAVPTVGPVEGAREEAEGPPAQWLRDVQALRAASAPPADWVARVRQGAPQLLARVERMSAPRAREFVPAAVEAPSRRERQAEPLEAASADQPERAAPRTRRTADSVEARSKPLEAQAAALRGPPLPSGEGRGEGARDRVPRPTARAQWMNPHPSPLPKGEGTSTGTTSSGHELPPVPRTRSLGPATLTQAEPPSAPTTSRSETPLPPASEPPRSPAPKVVRPPAPIEPLATRVAAPGEQPVPPPPPAYPWNSEPHVSHGRVPRMDRPILRTTQAPDPWPKLVEQFVSEAQPPAGAPSEAPEPRQLGGPWPELPESPQPDPVDGAILLQQWERLSRLDREQRGE